MVNKIFEAGIFIGTVICGAAILANSIGYEACN